MSWDAVWEQVYRSQTWGKYPSEDLIRFVARGFYSAPDRSQVRILELGCGPGPNLWYLTREGFSFVGMDGSTEAVAQAGVRLDAESPGWKTMGELCVGDFAQIPYPPATFDAVIDHESVYCNDYEASKRIYAAAANVLKPGGLIFVRTFAAGSWGDGTGESLGHRAWRCAEGPISGKGYARFTARDEIADLLSGFDLLSIEKISRTMDGGQKEVVEWVITGRKASE